MAMARVDEQRRADRVPVRLVTSRDGGRYPLTLLNLSTTGMLLSSPRPLYVGDTVEVDLPEVGPTEAEVLWGEADEYGCRFRRPIPESVVTAAAELSRRNRPRTDTRPRRLPEERNRERDDTRALTLLIVFLAVIVTLFYAVQAVIKG